ncbi:formate dehydrogenase accessory sulfurtransferase FdhD [Parageobacillus toebii NBRC 107807]|uniref:Sulfur carrier protein FdhD n=1 Tax=Parageobacillus toebii NBRC 107807 TaxID=1223503 RepID=A0A6G9J321_9BACL|nr:formate dehydrogenase accessory sulfurtransferase FdhD [Parageobacillus toebii]MBB3868889.1 FdhD protein [Parageobacillus toebii NBRC 107807]MED4970602.1 formate dehydrogenase accessory sulfurtransferase FdhD [Parageobacillus toebii]QIQ32579.1 formate dehydrogenase accessory sulfurtransferase FdhD [Parageobacillus toebii NBRC 107807]WMT20466.1 formate dehydrogenase accessory sulfurtransferase FdhD [Parageobacillus toebii]
MESFVTRKQKIVKYRDDRFEELDDEVAVEFPLTIVVDGQEFATMVCTPTHLEELVIGFLASEGLIRSSKEIKTISIDEHRGFAYVELVTKQSIQKEFYAKRFIGSCCGKSRQFYFYNDMKTAKTVVHSTSVHVEQCFRLMRLLQKRSTDFQATGGVHNAALCTPNDLVIVRSDIGRHNTLDKIYGYCLQHDLQLSDKLIAFSGRVSSEVLLKVSKMGIGIILSKSAPTTLALELANDLGITIVGFIRGHTFNVYTHPNKITGLQEKNIVI